MNSAFKRIRIVDVVALFLLSSCLCISSPVIAASQESSPTEGKGTLSEAAKNVYMATVAEHDVGHATVEDVYIWSRRLKEAEIDGSVTKADRIKAISDHVDRMQNMHAKAEALFKNGTPGGTSRNFHATKYYLLEAQSELKSAKETAQ